MVKQMNTENVKGVKEEVKEVTYKGYTADDFREMFDYNPETGELINKGKGRSKIGQSAYRDLTCNGVKYNAITLQSKPVLAHRVIYFMVYGELPEMVDHINQDPKDNRLENLRAANSTENQRNRKLSKNNLTGYHGISARKGKRGTTYKVFIGIDGKNKYLGTYNTLEEAKAARKSAELLIGYHPNHGQLS